MAGKKENIKALFSNTRTRVIILFTLILLVTCVLVGLYKFRVLNKTDALSSANVKHIPTNIHSIPGSLDQTEQYATLQNKQNIDQAASATKSGGSAIPTIIKTQAFGDGVDLVGPQYGEGGPGFVTLSHSNADGASKSLWFQQLQTTHCSAAAIKEIVDKGASLSDLREECSCCQLRQYGYTLPDLNAMCSCSELKVAGFTARELKDAGYSMAQLNRCGFSACETRGAGASAEDMKEGGFTDGELKGAGFSDNAIDAASGLPDGVTADDVRAAGCDPEKLAQLRKKGVTAAAVERMSGCSAAQLKAAGYSAADLKRAGFTAAELKKAGFTADDLKNAGFSDKDIEQAEAAGLPATKPVETSAAEEAAIRAAGCDADKLKALRAKGITAKQIHDLNGCTAEQLKAAGFSAKDLANAGFTPAELLKAGFDSGALNNAGLIPSAVIAAGRKQDCQDEDLKAAQKLGVSALLIRETLGCPADKMKAAGYPAQALKDAGNGAAALKNAGFSTAALKDAGFPAEAMKAAGLTDVQLKAAGYSVDKPKPTPVPTPEAAGPSKPADKIPTPKENSLTSIPALPSVINASDKNAQSGTKQLQDLISQQQSHASDQKYQAKVKQLSGRMVSAAGQALQNWKNVSSQVFIMGKEDEASDSTDDKKSGGLHATGAATAADDSKLPNPNSIFVKTGDILFAVLDTAVNTDEPGPILATIVSGTLKGSKLIGSFTLPSNADQMVITFNTLSMQGVNQTISISAYAIDPNTARTALASRVNHHYLMRYGSLFASTFLEGFSSAIQSADTTITIGGTGGTTDTTVQNGINRSLLENALIGLGEVGKAWSETAEKLMNRPTTVELFSGTGMGILFTQDVQIG